jgi:hypothetical protein
MDKRSAQGILWLMGGIITGFTLIALFIASVDPTVVIPLNLGTIMFLTVSVIWSSCVVVRAVK